MSTQVLFYSGQGTWGLSSSSLCSQLEKNLDPNKHRITQIQSLESLNNLLDPSSIRAIILPGGNALQMLRNVNVATIKRNITQLMLTKGVGVYGSCAGAIVLSSKLYGTDSPAALSSHVDVQATPYDCLNLYPGSAIASIGEPLPLSPSVNSFKIWDINTELGVIPTAHILGPGFLDVSSLYGATVLSTYTNLPSLTFEKGGESIAHERIAESVHYKTPFGAAMVLSGSHPEIGSDEILRFGLGSLNTTARDVTRISNKLLSSDDLRQSILRARLKSIGLSCIPG